MDEVLPRAPYRHVVLSFPFEVRGLLAFRASVLNAAVRLADEAVLRWQRRRMEGAEVRVGGVSVVQRAGDSLNANPHVHLLVADGGWREEPGGSACFVAATPPTLEELAELASDIGRRLMSMLRWRKLSRREGDGGQEGTVGSAMEGCVQLGVSHAQRPAAR